MLLQLAALSLALAPTLPAAPQGPLGRHPGTGTGFVRETHQSGQAAELRLVEIYWGRLVEVRDNRGVVRFNELLIGPDIQSDGVTFELAKNAFTQVDSLTILHPVKSPKFRRALRRTQSGLVQLLDKGIDPSTLPPFTMVPRNSAFALRFNDLLDDGGLVGSPGWPGTVNPQNLRLSTGLPPQLPFEARVLPDPSHGAYIGGQFHSTRALIAFTTSPLQAQQTGAVVNLVGLPAALATTVANGLLRVPTLINPAAAQFETLTNLAGNGLGFSNNGSGDPFSPTLDIVRAFRSGGDTAVTGDPSNGFLPDAIPPEVLGEQVVSVLSVQMSGNILVMDLQFQAGPCAWTPRAGDVVQTATGIFEVSVDGSPPVSGLVQQLPVRLLHGAVWPGTSQGLYATTWDPSSGALPGCFVTFSPAAASPPSAGVDVNADIQLRFSEPMQANSIDPFDAFSVRYGVNPAGANPLYESVVGAVLPGSGLARFDFQPTLPLAHAGSTSQLDTYTVVVGAGARAPRDLVGNSLAQVLPPVTFSISSSSPVVDSKSLALRFDSADEDGNGAPELRGQFFHDFAQGVLRPRPVTRLSAQADPVQHPTTAAMIPITKPFQEPLSPLGSKLMSVWRYHDLGFGLLDESTHNLDVEGLWWEPFGGTVAQDSFDLFQMSLSHSVNLPDEAVNPGLLPKWPQSGLDNTFAANQAETPVIVHQKPQGYVISALDLQLSPTGRVLAPWPMNRNLAPNQYVRFPWRDTASLVMGAPNGTGADTQRLAVLSGFFNTHMGFYPADEVPTIGLPLLTEFRTYPTTSASGFNGFQIAIAINSSAQPYFRTHSTGGAANTGIVTVDPDQEVAGKGGINPNNGKNTQPRDNAFYYGQADFVVRVSRLHTIWLDTLGVSQFAPATVIPSASRQPAGTQVILAYRGASGLTSQVNDSWEDATNFDPYGESYTAKQHCMLLGANNGCPEGQQEFTPTFFPNAADESWTSDITALDGASFIQTRVTLIANPDTGELPEVSAIGFSFLQ